MLRELRIRNLAVIESVAMSFVPGFTVLTGETGAGKSILIDALLLLRGARAHTDLIRSGAETAIVEAVVTFDDGSPALAVLEEAGLGSEDGEWLVRRELSRSGRHRAFINDLPVTVGLLERLGDSMVEVHGQHEHQRLLEPSHQLEMLDAYAEIEAQREAFAALFAKRQAARNAVEAQRTLDRDRAQRLDLLRFQASEIDAARLAPGEEDALRAERRRIAHAERLAAGLTEIVEVLYDDPASAAARLARAGQILRELERLDPDCAAPGEPVELAAGAVDEAARQARRLRDSVVFDPARLEEIDGRLDVLARLKRKYGDSIEAILSHRTAITADLDRLERHEEILATIERELAALEAELAEAAHALSAGRAGAAVRLAAHVQRELRQVGVDRAVFEIGVAPLGQLSATGGDRVEFRLSANPGETVRPLARVASGGELSRTMLALKTALVARDRAPTMVFDEIDAGIGGGVADMVGQKLAAIARERQVLCVTHLAPIAARATAHQRVAKSVRGGRTSTAVSALSGGERVEEIARMLGGEALTDAARCHARELLAQAEPSPRARPR
jgi:DNA repair protein RecN (Recombination protein N)